MAETVIMGLLGQSEYVFCGKKVYSVLKRKAHGFFTSVQM